MRLVALIFIVAAAAAAQPADGLTVSVSRTVTVVPDQAEFSVVVTAALDTTAAQVLQAFQDLGIPNPQVSGVVVAASGYPQPPAAESQVYYMVTFITAPSALIDVSKKLDAFRAGPPAGFAALQYSAGLTASTAALTAAHDATLPKLLDDARIRAQTLAAASGLKVGAIGGIADYTYAAPGYYLSSALLAAGATSTSNSNVTGTQYSFSVGVRFSAQ